MAYRVNAKFKDGSTNGPLADIVAEQPPHAGDTISVSKQGEPVLVLVTAVWTPWQKSRSHAGPVADPLIVVEAREA
jgi:hypothetical protein